MKGYHLNGMNGNRWTPCSPFWQSTYQEQGGPLDVACFNNPPLLSIRLTNYHFGSLNNKIFSLFTCNHVFIHGID
eukprot:m.40795 g.40795  ORF g.40795 m.40795 type:complete len:75 (-) comp6947_c0_seq1:325-549(-)